ncbi:SMC family ATPase [Sedimentibacter hydroxybenzoicus DSM 7310]|uniref:Nuclease SbcCD subunit C n=1 Tax=Sedimentibacter hydroxybenzoicus DSM 7310 TaxID=1123245 RepID=A0A974GV31_SEDHY|nr:SMC family ATPase [Sedimentibacter hydroxybenzoicus]NYB72937.1 SMC family ATPase [Sedimentibacter hydroxybenzoicus DSM 7310]
MKPLNLKIKGLNSFIELQEVNFERLTERGLFGIFGPTGSGKSTILDGIILSLYGCVPRDSSNFMNINCDTMNVCFEFQITEKDAKRYRVEREFKRDKSGSIKTRSAKIIDITSDEIVLEDMVRQVDSKCREIIGLEVDDFTRTVVLPQGNFSEFLKLQGKERREMLERLFNLQKYGDKLSNKLSLRIGKDVQSLNVLEGELKGFENVSDEILESTEKLLNETKIQIENLSMELASAEKEYNEGKEVWDLQKELISIDEKEKSLKEQENEIKELNNRVIKGESALKVKPYIEAYENTLKQIEAVSKTVSELKQKALLIENHKNSVEQLYVEAKNKKDINLPVIKVKEQKILDAIEEKSVLGKLTAEKLRLEESKNKTEEEIKNANQQLLISENNILKLNDNINSKESKFEQLKVAEEFKDKVNAGFLLISSYDNLIGQTNKISKEIKEISDILNEESTLSEMCSKELNDKDELLKSNERALNVINEKCPGDQNTLLKLKENLDEVKNKWEKNKEFTELINKARNNTDVLKIELKTKEDEALVLSKEIESSKDVLKRQEAENIAHILRQELSDGEVCPVCGSTSHHQENIKLEKFDFNVETYRNSLNAKEEKAKKLTAEIIKIQTNLVTEENIIKQSEAKLNELGEDYKKVSLENLKNDFQKQIIEVNRYNDDKSKLEKNIRTLSEEKSKLLLKYNKITSSIDHNRVQLKKLGDELKLKSDEAEEKKKELNKVKAELQIVDFVKVKEEINNKENERSLLEKEIKEHRESLKTELGLKDKSLNKLNELKIFFKEMHTTIYEKNKSIDEKTESIKNKSGGIEDLEDAKEQISALINQISEEYEKLEKSREAAETQFKDCNNEIMSAQGNLISLKERCEKDNSSLKNVLEEEGLKDAEEAKIKYVQKFELDNFKKQIDAYINSLAQIRGASINLKNKLNGRFLTEEQWVNIRNMKSEKAEMLDKLNEEKIILESEAKKAAEKLTYKKELEKNKGDLSHKLALLRDLEKLFRGKKFVEFVAANQLKYVSIEAGRRLKEISGGTYGLEVDQDSKFLIRDYKNGGAQRDASTLSGGETFVASLALALALSSQIQLKGTAPLELFFLDEGFGTLDDNLLEVVMDSLEKIHNDKLSVGIISHVESIKGRVPLKLIVTPAVAGMGGSKVKIEIS